MAEEAQSRAEGNKGNEVKDKIMERQNHGNCT
jgi:hypothetical protein